MSETPVTMVTGAGSGVGRAVCGQLAAAGHRVALLGRRPARLEATRATMMSGLVLPTDVTDPPQLEAAVERTHREWGRIDAIVNNAGLAPLAPIEATDAALLERTFAVNAFAAARLIALVWPLFRQQAGGCIVNVSSLASSDPLPGFFAYGAAKAALESLTRSAMVEGGEFGVRAFSVAPGAVETEMLRKLFPPEQVPREQTLDPAGVAAVIVECILGRRDDEAGRCILLRGPQRG